MTINISGQVPAEAQNGMYDLEEAWQHDRTPAPVFAVVPIKRSGFKFDDAKQERRVTMKFAHIEPLDGEAAEAAMALLNQACGHRGGSVATDTPLDIPDVDEPALDLDTPLQDGKAV